MQLDNKIIGRNLSKFRRLQDIKAADLADRIGMKEAAYTKYERGETAITLEFVQKVADALKVDPITILSASPDNFIESITNNTPTNGSQIGNENMLEVKGDFNAVDKPLLEGLLKQNDTIIKLIEKVIELWEKK
jgi:transcriptional regulator with XRE-family HTH domain